MDQSCLRRSKLIKQLHVVVWGVLLVAGGLLGSRVFVSREPALVKYDANASAPDGLPSVQEDEATESGTSAKILEAPKRIYSERSVASQSVVSEPLEVPTRTVAIVSGPIVETPFDDAGDFDDAASNHSDEETSDLEEIENELVHLPETAENRTESFESIEDPIVIMPVEPDAEPPRVVSGPAISSELAAAEQSTVVEIAEELGDSIDGALLKAKRDDTIDGTSAGVPLGAAVVVGPKRPKVVSESSPDQPKQHVESSKLSTSKQLALTIRNPAAIGYPVAFLYGNEQQRLQPGDVFKTEAKRGEKFGQLVKYDRGGDFGEAQERLAPGQYEFKVTRSGWQIVPVKTKKTKKQNAK